MDGNVEITFPLGELAYKALSAEMDLIKRIETWHMPNLPYCIIIGNVKFELRKSGAV